MFALRIAYGHCLLLQRFSEVGAYLRNGALCNMTSLPTQEPMMAVRSKASESAGGGELGCTEKPQPGFNEDRSISIFTARRRHLRNPVSEAYRQLQTIG